MSCHASWCYRSCAGIVDGTIQVAGCTGSRWAKSRLHISRVAHPKWLLYTQRSLRAVSMQSDAVVLPQSLCESAKSGAGLWDEMSITTASKEPLLLTVLPRWQNYCTDLISRLWFRTWRGGQSFRDRLLVQWLFQGTGYPHGSVHNPRPYEEETWVAAGWRVCYLSAIQVPRSVYQLCCIQGREESAAACTSPCYTQFLLWNITFFLAPCPVCHRGMGQSEWDKLLWPTATRSRENSAEGHVRSPADFNKHHPRLLVLVPGSASFL